MCLPKAIVCVSCLPEVSAHAKLIDLDYFTLAMSDKKRFLTKIFFLLIPTYFFCNLALQLKYNPAASQSACENPTKKETE
jgi:hypothetical protein